MEMRGKEIVYGVEQYNYLMDNAIEVSQELELTLGIALSKELEW